MLHASYTASNAREESNKFKARNSEPTIDQINLDFIMKEIEKSSSKGYEQLVLPIFISRRVLVAIESLGFIVETQTLIFPKESLRFVVETQSLNFPKGRPRYDGFRTIPTFCIISWSEN
jgi:hypothetical protein